MKIAFFFTIFGSKESRKQFSNAPVSEVARTRMREAGGKYRSFWQTLRLVHKEEGRVGLYRGLGTQLVRQIPNTAIMMATYELTVYLLKQQFS